MTASKSSRNTRAVFFAAAIAAAIAALVLFLALPARHHAGPNHPPQPYGPIRSIGEITRNAAPLTGQIARIQGHVVALRDLNPGQPFPWDVVYTVQDGTGTLPVHWFVQAPRPKSLTPPVQADGMVRVTGKVKRHLELEGKTYPVILSELTELHNQEHPALPAAPSVR